MHTEQKSVWPHDRCWGARGHGLGFSWFLERALCCFTLWQKREEATLTLQSPVGTNAPPREQLIREDINPSTRVLPQDLNTFPDALYLKFSRWKPGLQKPDQARLSHSPQYANSLAPYAWKADGRYIPYSHVRKRYKSRGSSGPASILTVVIWGLGLNSRTGGRSQLDKCGPAGHHLGLALQGCLKKS